MKGRAAIRVGLVITVLGAVLAPGPAGAARRPNVSAVGDATCIGRLKLTAVKARVSTGDGTQNSTATFTLKGKLPCSGTTGNSAVRPVLAKVAGSLVAPVHDCISSHGAIGVKRGWALTLGWKASGGRMAPTTVAFTNSEGISHVDSLRRIPGWQLPSAVAPVGSSFVQGSYGGIGTATGYILAGHSNIVDWFDSWCGGSKQRAELLPVVVNL